MGRRDVLQLARRSPFGHWSPLALAHALGFQVHLRAGRGGTRDAFLVGPSGRDHPTSHARAWMALSRLAARQGVDPAQPPAQPRRAVVEGRD